jgi:hypothetical protein
MPGLPFTVMVADNFHYMDEDEKYELGKFATLEDAIAASKRIVDASLASALKPGMSADALFRQYTSFGEDPYILGSRERGVPFSAREYAKAQCLELCASQRAPNVDGDVV